MLISAPFLRPIPTDGLSMDDVFNAPANLINGVASSGGGEPERLPPPQHAQLLPVRKGERETPSNCLPPPPAPAQGDQPAQINPRQVTMADKEQGTQQHQEQPQAPHPASRTAGLKDPKAIALMNIAVPATGKSIIRHPKIKFPSYFDNETRTDFYRTRDGIIKVVHDDNDTVTAIELAKQEG
jgi:hypothetical protein